MPVKLRLRRQGRKKAPHYSIVVADSRAPRDGKYIEKVGFYNPITNPAHIFVDHELALKWLSVGAQPTHTVRSILRHAGVTLKFALIKQGKNDEEMERIFNSWWEMKKARKKKKFIQVDVHGKPLEDTPMVEMAEHRSTTEPESATEEANSEGEADAAKEEEAVVAVEATAAEETPTPEAEDTPTPEDEAVQAETEDTPALEAKDTPTPEVEAVQAETEDTPALEVEAAQAETEDSDDDNEKIEDPEVSKN